MDITARRIHDNAANFARAATKPQNGIVVQNENLKPSEAKFEASPVVEMPEDFYDALESELAEWAKRCGEYTGLYGGEGEIDSDEEERDCDLFVDFGGGSAEVSLRVTLYSEWVDESFDHAFGTWDDPHPHYVPTAVAVAEVYSVKAYDDDGEEAVRLYDRERIGDMEINRL